MAHFDSRLERNKLQDILPMVVMPGLVDKLDKVKLFMEFTTLPNARLVSNECDEPKSAKHPKPDFMKYKCAEGESSRNASL